MLYNIIIAPIEAIVGWVFMFIINKITSIGVIGAICGVSIVINILALPLYNIADSIQEKERQINKKMEYRVKRIKKAFKGDEQFMMLSEYYRQNNYHPLYALRGSLSILIEIPFFIAAYNYLSSSEILKESSFWIFSNLGEPDRMFSFSLGTLTIPINILPIVMTLINFISGYIYTKDATTRDKVQLYALGLFFLVLLYNSPSGLVIYWILNNIFSLVKTIVLKTKHPGRFLHAFISLGLIAFTYKFKDTENQWKFFFLVVITLLFISFPFLKVLLNNLKEKYNLKIKKGVEAKRNYFVLVLFSGLALSFLCGFLLTSSTIQTNPAEFCYLGSIKNPTKFVWSSLYFFLGLFVFWPLVIYKMFGNKTKRYEAIIMALILIVALFDAFVFKSDYGTIDTQLRVQNPEKLQELTKLDIIKPFIVAIISFALVILVDRFNKLWILSTLIFSVFIGEVGIGGYKLNSINTFFKEYSKTYTENKKENDDKIESVFHLSKDKENVIVLFLDRAVNSFFPYALEQIPELKEQFDGFVYYPNTLSFSDSTITGSPSMYGGYEYTPTKMNEREGLLKDIHNEALLVAPTLFKNEGFSVTVTDPPFPNYSWRGDLSAFEKNGINAFDLYGNYASKYYKETSNKNVEDESLLTERETKNFSILQILPPMLRFLFEKSCRDVSDSSYYYFVNAYSSLYYFKELTDFNSDNKNYLFIANEAPHESVFLAPNYLQLANNRDESVEICYQTNDDSVYKHFAVFSASLKRVGEWLDYLKENDAYDNTRIVIVSDHGKNLNLNDISPYEASFTPLLLFKDFNSRGEIVVDNSFMTNADAIFLSKEGLIDSSVNPYTKEILSQEKENGIIVYPIAAGENNSTRMKNASSFTLEKENASHVSSPITDESNWTPLLKWEEENK